MNKQIENNGDWARCPDGELALISRGLRSQRTRRDRRRMFVLSSALLLCVAIGMYAAGRVIQTTPVAHGGVTCAEVAELLPRYLTGDLTMFEMHQVQKHLAACPACRDTAEELDHQSSIEMPRDLVAQF